MKKSVDNFSAYLDVLQGTLKYAEASRALGLHPSTIFHWLKQSKAAAQNPAQPSEFLFEYADELAWLHEHVRAVITISVEEIEAAARGRALHGHTSIARFQGKTVWAENPDTIGLDDETLKLCGYKDRLLRDSVGRPVPEIIT